MKLFTKEQIKRLKRNASDEVKDPFPVVKLFNPTSNAGTWLLTELSEDEEYAFGLCDMGMGMSELGYVSISEITSVKLPFGLTIERDMCFTAEHPLSVYVKKAQMEGGINI